MVVQIQYDSFAEEFHRIDIYPGLSAVLGRIGGSNALGKFTFL